MLELTKVTLSEEKWKAHICLPCPLCAPIPDPLCNPEGPR